MAHPHRESVSVVGPDIIGALLFVVFILFFISSAMENGAPAIFPIFGIGMLVMFVVMVITSAGKAAQYREAQTRYEARRRQLLDALRQRQRPR
jgi:TRAP-type C4-dicarboxylate transport system permease small subunit